MKMSNDSILQCRNGKTRDMNNLSGQDIISAAGWGCGTHSDPQVRLHVVAWKPTCSLLIFSGADIQFRASHVTLQSFLPYELKNIKQKWYVKWAWAE